MANGIVKKKLKLAQSDAKGAAPVEAATNENKPSILASSASKLPGAAPIKPGTKLILKKSNMKAPPS